MNEIFWVGFAALWVLVAIQGFAFLELLRQVADLRKQLGLRPGALVVPGAVDTGSPLPAPSGVSAATLRPISWGDYLGEGLGVIVVLRSSCSSCREVAGDLTGFASDVWGEARVAALVVGKVDEARAFVADTKLDPKMVIIDVGGATADRLGVAFNPGAVTVLGGRLGHAAIVNSVEQIHALIGEERRSEGGELAVRPLGVGPEAFAREVTP